MANLPVSGEIYFQDFSFDLLAYTLTREGKIITVLKGLTNDDEDGRHIAFLIGTDLFPGDILEQNNKHYMVKSVDIDTFDGHPEIIKAYY
jgi:hypothetical protein